VTELVRHHELVPAGPTIVCDAPCKACRAALPLLKECYRTAAAITLSCMLYILQSAPPV
jgi:hypothetical protein